MKERNFKKPTKREELKEMQARAKRAREIRMTKLKPKSEKRVIVCVSLKPREHEYLKRLGKGKASHGIKMLLPLYVQSLPTKIDKREKPLNLRKVNITNDDLI